jgi:hypothetical protein
MLEILMDRGIGYLKLYISIPSFITSEMIRKTMNAHKIPKKPEQGIPGWDYDRGEKSVYLLWYPDAKYSMDDCFHAVYDLAGISATFTTGDKIRSDAN